MSDTFQYREEIDLQKMVDEQARELQRRVDEATLDQAADTLAKFGYVKADGKSRWAELFGTPERAARTLAVGDRHADCGECVIREACYSSDMGCLVEEPEVLLEWLRGDAE